MSLPLEVQRPEGRVKVRLKTNSLKGLLVLGVGAGGSMAAGLAMLQLFERDPKEGFALLKSWGPWALIVAFVVFVLWKLMSEAIQVVREGMSAWVRTAEKGADAQARTADALTKLADQGGRSAEEVRRLTVYAAQEFPCVYERFDSQDKMLKEMTQSIVALSTTMIALTTRLNEDAQQRRREGP